MFIVGTIIDTPKLLTIHSQLIIIDNNIDDKGNNQIMLDLVYYKFWVHRQLYLFSIKTIVNIVVVRLLFPVVHTVIVQIHLGLYSKLTLFTFSLLSTVQLLVTNWK